MKQVRFTMGTIMMFVLMVAAAMALFVKTLETSNSALPGWDLDIPILFILAILLTAVALGSWKQHTAVQVMVQITVVCVGYLSLIWLSEAQLERAIRYWCQGIFAVTVTLPLLARRFIKTRLPRGPRRDWWKKMCEAVFFSFLTMLLVTAGGAIQGVVNTVASALSAGRTTIILPPPVMPAAPIPPLPLMPEESLDDALPRGTPALDSGFPKAKT